MIRLNTPGSNRARVLVAAFTCAAPMLSSTATHAYQPLKSSSDWPISWWSLPDILINTGSLEAEFQADGHMTGITATQWEGFILATANTWTDRSGAAVSITYSGRTERSCEDADGYNVVGGAYDDEGPLAWTGWTNSSSGEFYEADICVNGAFEFSFQYPTPGSRYDLWSTLIHEFGHFFGADHVYDDTIMFDGYIDEVNSGLWEDDHDFIRDTYGEIFIPVQIAEWYNGGWSDLGTVAGTTNAPIGATLGKVSSAWTVVRAQVSAGRTSVRFYRTAYPATSGSSWTNTNYSGRSLEDGVGLAADPTSGVWIALYPEPTLEYGCDGMNIMWSDDAFATTDYDFAASGWCAMNEVGVAYEPYRDRFVAAYVATGADSGESQYQVYLRTSVSGVDWYTSTRVATGLYTSTGVRVACDNDGDCVVSVVDGEANSRRDRMRSFTINSSGLPILGSETSSQWWVYDPIEPFDTSRSSSGTVSLLPAADMEESYSGIYDRTGGGFPVTSGSWTSQSGLVRQGLRVASSYDRLRAFLFWLEY